MKKLLTLWLFIFLVFQMHSQTATVIGQLLGPEGTGVIYANIALYDTADSTLVKVETSDETGVFIISGLNNGAYKLNVSFIGLEDYESTAFSISESETRDLGTIKMNSSSIELETAIVTAKRAIVEIKSDRTVFNVQGTINSSGDNGLDLLRKAPGLLIDNNENITVLGRSGVLFYIDGKRLPLSGEDLTNYLKNLNSEQIDKIEIITNPGAKYEAQGNAGIIDIRLKKNENHGTNGSISMNTTKATDWRNNINLSLNSKNDFLNSFGQISLNKGKTYQYMVFNDVLNGVNIVNDLVTFNDNKGVFLRWGTDFTINKYQTIGFLVSGNVNDGLGVSDSKSIISSYTEPNNIDSILIATNRTYTDFNSQTYNVNYMFNKENTSLTINADYGKYRRDANTVQPNTYFESDGETVRTFVNTAFDTPNNIDILTFKADYETDFAGGRLGLGAKLSKVETDNTFLFFNVIDEENIQDNRRSNLFLYSENVIAGYTSYARSFGKKLSFNAGLRVEQTDASGDLQAFLPELQEDPVDLNYTSLFPNAGFSYTYKPEYVFSLNYGRRINRPDYNVLNPFKSQINELSFRKGNPFLRPEIVNNIEFGFLWKYRYNFKLAYSRTSDQITRLIGPDESDPRASFINWDNLAMQTIVSMNISAPVQFTDFWSGYFNLSANFLDNQADYGDGGVIDLQAYSYNIFQQHTFSLPKGWSVELSGYFNSPGIWGGVFEFDSSWALNFGLQKKFLNDKLNVRLSVQDIFFQAYWSGQSNFNGLISTGEGNWDSRRGSISASYSFGNQKVKSKSRKSGLEEEASRVQGDN